MKASPGPSEGKTPPNLTKGEELKLVLSLKTLLKPYKMKVIFKSLIGDSEVFIKIESFTT